MIKLHWGQSRVYKELFIDKTCRFSVVNCSRGWGKTHLAATAAATAVFELMQLADDVPNKSVDIVAPTHDQATEIYHPLMAYELGLEDFALSHSRDTGKFLFPGNVRLNLTSYEAIERMRGKGKYFVVWDEPSSCKKGAGPKDAWESVIQPCITTRWSETHARAYDATSPGRALIIGTPKGYNYFHTLAMRHETESDWGYHHFDYTQSPLLDKKEIERERDRMDPIKFSSEYGALFAESGARVFYCFDRQLHVRNDLAEIQDGEQVFVCIDFNVGLQCSAAFVVRGGQAHFMHEFKGSPDTETLGIKLKHAFPNNPLVAFPDPSGRSRKTSATVGKTDFSILQGLGIQCVARSAAPSIVDSVAAVNRMLKTASGKVSMYVHPRCHGLIASLERTKWVDNRSDSALIDKSEGVEHFSDGVRYGIEYLFPVQSGTKTTVRGFGF